MNTPEILRTFIAIPLPDPIISQLDRAQRRLQRTCPNHRIRWVNPRTIHLTLYFIGDMPETQVSKIERVLSDVVMKTTHFKFTIENLGTFPNSRRPNIIWAGVVDKEHKLTVLHKMINLTMAQVGFPAETRKFTPHLTIGRVNRKTSRDKRVLIGREVDRTDIGKLGTVDVTDVVFYRSILKHTGAEHYPLAEFPLRK